MKLYVVSSKPALDLNWGFVSLVTAHYDRAHEKAEIGHFIHVITTDEVMKMVQGGKMAIKVDLRGDPI